MTDSLNKPEDRLEITIDGATRDIFMSAGMLRVLCNIVSLQDDLTCIFVDPSVQELCLLEILAERNKLGKPVTPIAEMSLLAYDLNTEEAMKLTKWMGEHTLHFFTVGTKMITEELPKSIARMNELTASMNGLEDSVT